MILAGDVGGTKTILALFKRAGGKLRKVREATYPSADSPSLEAMIRSFLAAGREKVDRCAVGVAGPVVGGRSHVVNLRWPVDERKLSRSLGVKGVRVLNDLEATAWGIRELPARKLLNLTPGLRPRPGNAALIAAGTGLGTAILFWDGKRHHPSAGEGGHQSFAPRDDLEIELLRYLRPRYGRVSVERIVAGPGFSEIYEFLVQTGQGVESPKMTRRMAEGDPNAAISEAGVEGADATAEAAIDLFVSLYGDVAGDLALVARATAGVYVGGGIAPKILPKLRSGGFLKAFRSKGRLTPFLEGIPVKVILEPRTALIGAAACAGETLKPTRRGPARTQARR
jgi:glucokinase